ncbi:MAG: hypothetical protein JW820_17800 [Spirochaetales bacterium]|nr:hypothetical protein [Spirochaetales bacterium]
MSAARPTVSSSLLEAMADYSVKIRRIVTHDPGNKVELACLYAGISGIKECMTALRNNGFVSDAENRRLEEALEELYALCSPSPP